MILVDYDPWEAEYSLKNCMDKNYSFYFEKDGKILEQSELSQVLNRFYASVSIDIPPLDRNELPAFPPTNVPVLTIQPYAVSKKLLAVKSFKAHMVLITFHAVSLRSLPTNWLSLLQLSSMRHPHLVLSLCDMVKDSDIIPIPKSQPPTCEDDTRPISLTSYLSKVLEVFVVRWMISDIESKIDPQQFGCLKGTSTTYCLLDRIHTWLCKASGKHLRLCFLDFTKAAFDRIGHNLLISKLLDLGDRSSLIPWIINFLTNRRHCVKLGGNFSDWLPMNAGVPQGTKLGPIFFLVMINDLNVKTHSTDIWKFVDDVSTSENILKNSE